MIFCTWCEALEYSLHIMQTLCIAAGFVGPLPFSICHKPDLIDTLAIIKAFDVIGAYSIGEGSLQVHLFVRISTGRTI